MTPGYELHPVTGEWADFSKAELMSLTEDIQTNGLCQPITVWKGLIVDGRHRLMICSTHNIPIRTVDISEECPTEDQMRTRVRSLNQHRRSRTKPMTNKEKQMRVRAELEKNPERSDRAIADAAGVSHPVVKPVREALEAKEESKQVEKSSTSPRVGRDGKTYRFSGPRIATPEGMSVSDCCRRGLALERKGATVPDAARQIGIRHNTYQVARQVVLLADRNDLNETDSSIAKRAIALMDKDRQYKGALELIKPLAKKVWGHSKSSKSDAVAQRRTDAFKKAISVIVQACSCGEDMPLPHVNKTDASEAIKQLTESMTALRRLRSKIKREMK